MLRSSDTHHYQKQQEQRKDKDVTLKRGRQVLWKLDEEELNSEPSGDSIENTVEEMNHQSRPQAPTPPRRDSRQEQEQDQQEDRANQSIEHQTGDSNKPKRNPFCSRCRNHGKSAQVKGHKRHCEYRDCQCGGCRLVECRQIVSAAQIKRRRDQKQDEECGRRIKVSPKVLTREPSTDPAALIAKTLIGSATAASKQYQIQPPHEQQVPASSHQLQHPHPHPQHLSDVLSIAVSPAAGATAASIMPTNSNHHLLQYHHQTTALNQNGGPIASADQHQQHPLHCAHLNLNHLGQLHHQANGSHLNQTSNVAATIAGAIGCPAPASSTNAANSALSNALQLFNFPNSFLSVGAAASLSAHANNHHHHQHPLHNGHHLANHHLAAPTAVFPTAAMAMATATASTTAPSSASNVSTTPDSPRPPSIREQINLVEEIYQTFGPRAIYAWLKAEQFDLQKVRDSIEISRTSYDNLMDLKSKYRLSGSNNNNHHKQTNIWY